LTPDLEGGNQATDSEKRNNQGSKGPITQKKKEKEIDKETTMKNQEDPQLQKKPRHCSLDTLSGPYLREKRTVT